MTERELECLVYLLFGDVVSVVSGCITQAEMLSVDEFENMERVTASFVEQVPGSNWVDLHFRHGEHFRLRIERLVGGEKP